MQQVGEGLLLHHLRSPQRGSETSAKLQKKRSRAQTEVSAQISRFIKSTEEQNHR